MNIDRLEWHLSNWVDYMSRPSHKLGYPSRSLCIASGGGSSIDEFEIMCEESDINSAMKLDAMIDSLGNPERVAINHVWLKAKHCYPTQEYDYEMAIISLLSLAEKRGLI